MRLGKRTIKSNSVDFKKIILYILVILFLISFFSSIIIAIILCCSDHDMSFNFRNITADNTENPILGQFGPISTVILLIGIPFLILFTTITYAIYISTEGIKDKLLSF